MMQSERLQLRPMERTDTDLVLRMRNDPHVLTQLFSEAAPTKEEHLRWLEQIQKRGDRQEFVIIERMTGNGIGTIGLSHIELNHRRAEFGILLGEQGARGKGLAREASRVLLEHAFKDLKLHRVYLQVFTENEPAIRMYRALGFEQEGILRQHVCKNGEFRDVLVMAILEGKKG